MTDGVEGSETGITKREDLDLSQVPNVDEETVDLDTGRRSIGNAIRAVVPWMRQLTPDELTIKEAMKGNFSALGRLTSLDAEVAEKLFKRLGKKWVIEINLNSLKTLSSETAAVLAKFDRDILLDGLTSLTKDAAIALFSLRKFRKITLNGLMEIDDDLAEGIANCEITDLELNGVKTVSDKSRIADYRRGPSGNIKEILSRWDVYSLSMNGYVEADDDVLEGLAAANIRKLFLDGIRRVPERGVRSENRRDRILDKLSLNGCKVMSAGAARGLADWRIRRFYLNGLESLDQDAAVELAKSECDYLNLMGLENPSEEVLESLTGFSGIALNVRVNDLDEEKAGILVNSRAVALLIRTVRVTPEVAKLLINFRGGKRTERNIYGNAGLTGGGLNLMVDSIDRETAEVLSQYSHGDLVVHCEEMSDEVRNILRRNRKIILEEGPIDLQRNHFTF